MYNITPCYGGIHSFDAVVVRYNAPFRITNILPDRHTFVGLDHVCHSSVKVKNMNQKLEENLIRQPHVLRSTKNRTTREARSLHTCRSNSVNDQRQSVDG